MNDVVIDNAWIVAANKEKLPRHSELQLANAWVRLLRHDMLSDALELDVVFRNAQGIFWEKDGLKRWVLKAETGVFTVFTADDGKIIVREYKTTKEAIAFIIANQSVWRGLPDLLREAGLTEPLSM